MILAALSAQIRNMRHPVCIQVQQRRRRAGPVNRGAAAHPPGLKHVLGQAQPRRPPQRGPGVHLQKNRSKRPNHTRGVG